LCFFPSCIPSCAKRLQSTGMQESRVAFSRGATHHQGRLVVLCFATPKGLLCTGGKEAQERRSNPFGALRRRKQPEGEGCKARGGFTGKARTRPAQKEKGENEYASLLSWCYAHLSLWERRVKKQLLSKGVRSKEKGEGGQDKNKIKKINAKYKPIYQVIFLFFILLTILLYIFFFILYIYF
jgi:hypothetical protein